MMKRNTQRISELTRNARQESESISRLLAGTERSYMLTDHIRSKLPGADINARSLDAVYEVSEACRQRSGVAPSGVYVPFSAMARELTTSSDTALSSALSTGRIVGDSVQPGLLPGSPILSGATILSGIKDGDIDLLAMDSVGDTSDAFVGEAGAGPTVEPSLVGTTLTPLNLRFQVVVSRLALVRSGPALESALRAQMARSAFSRIERGIVAGAGGDEPVGLLNHPGIPVLSAGANGAAPSWDHVVECEYDVASRNGDGGQPIFITSPKLRKKLRKTPRGSGLDYILPSEASVLLGRPLAATTQVPDNLEKGTSGAVCSAMIYGDVSEVFVGFWGPMALDVFVNPVTRAAEGEVILTCSAYVGIGVRHIKAFACYKDLLAS